MKKNFEQEYIELKTEELPDLWDRIEAGIDAGENTGSDTTAPTPVSEYITASSNPTMHKKHYRLLAGSTLAAAACLCVIIYALKLPKSYGDMSVASDMTNDASESGTYSEDAYYDSEYESAACEETESAGESDYIAAETEAAEDAQEAPASSEESVKGAATNKGASDETTALPDDATADETVAPITGTVISGVTVTVTSVENTGEEILFFATVSSDADSYFEAGSEVGLFISDNAFPDLVSGASYRLDLESQDNGYYRITKIY